MISSERAEEALNFLLDTDTKLALLEGELRNAEQRADIQEQLGFLEATGSNIKEKEAKAKTEARYLAALGDVTRAEIAYKTLKYERQTRDILINCWRTQESTRRAGV
jgi:RNase P/RNase MRP subunit POP5